MRNDLGNFALNSLTRWSVTAVECFKSKFDCLHCPTYYLLESQPCQMKAAVLELYKILGAPDEGQLKEGMHKWKKN